MKVIKFLIILLSLSLPIQSYACWDDDMDDDYDFVDDNYYYDIWWDDNDSSWDDDDYAWEIDLPDVVITPDDNSDSDDNQWINDVDDDNNNDITDDNDESWWDDDNYDDSWGSTDNEKEPNIPYKRYYEPKSDEHSLATEEKKLPGSWDRQDQNMNCTSTVLEYVANFLENSMLNDYQPYRTSFEQTFYEMFSQSLDIYGVNINQMNSFFNACGFECININFNDINALIDEKYPIIATVKNGSEDTAHEIFIVGYTDNGDFIAVNPTRGDYQNYQQDDFYGNGIYVLKQFK